MPEDIHAQLKARGFSPSELLRNAVTAEVHRHELIEQAETYLAELIAEVGEPTAADRAHAASIAEAATGTPAMAKVG